LVGGGGVVVVEAGGVLQMIPIKEDASL